MCMPAVIMDKKRMILLGTFNMVLILLLLLFMSECPSSTSHDVDTPSSNDTMSRKNEMPEFASGRNWPRRMLGGRPSAASNATTYRIHHKHNGIRKGLTDGSSPNNMASSFNNASKGTYQEDRLQAHDECSSSSTGCAHNATTIDPRYGVEKRLVPTGPNPLHN